MVEKLSEVKPPSGLTRWFFRLPLAMYKAGLGRLLGSRFVRIEHEGRVTGKPRQVVLEVVSSDRSHGVFYVVAAWGESADWFQNIKANPVIRYQVGSQSFNGVAEVLPVEQAGKIFVDYGRRHPRMLQSFMRAVGYQINRDEESFRALADHLPVVKLIPDREKGG